MSTPEVCAGAKEPPASAMLGARMSCFERTAQAGPLLDPYLCSSPLTVTFFRGLFLALDGSGLPRG